MLRAMPSGKPSGKLSAGLPIAGVTLAVLAVAIAFAPPSLWSYDAEIMAQVAHSIVTEGSFRVYNDSLNLNLPYASYGIGMSLLMVVSEVLAPRIGWPVATLDAFINPVLLALLAAVMWLVARRAGAGPRQAALIALVTALATPLLPYGVSTFSEVATALGVALGLLGLQLVAQRPVWGGVLAGVGIGVAGLMRTDSFVLVAPVIGLGVLAMATRRITAGVAVAAGVLPAIVITAAYNALRFGSPLVFQYQGSTLDKSFAHPFGLGLYGLTLSPGRGLLLYAPLVIVMAIAWRWSWRRSAVLTVVCAALVLDRILFYSGWWAWHGGVGWGPRFLVPALPALVPFLVALVHRLATARALPRVAFGVLVALSLAVQVVGSVTNPAAERMLGAVSERTASASIQYRAGDNFMEYVTTPEILSAWTDPMLDWSLSPIAEHAGQLVRGENILSRALQPGDVRYKRLAATLLLFLLGLAAAFYRRRRTADAAERVGPAEPADDDPGVATAEAVPAKVS
jgi:hypothetical protein